MNQTKVARQLDMLVEADLQAQHTSEPVAIRNLFNDRGLYDNYPKFQREFVWPEKFKRALIDSILRGFPIHPLLAFKEIDKDGVEKYWIADGHQRLSTVFEFLQGKFATASIAQSKKDEPRALPPVEPGRHFSELSSRAKNLFHAYKFTINVVQDIDEESMGLIFRRVQHQLPLSVAEKLASFRSRAIEYAIKLQEHEVWSDIYIGNDRRKETLQGSLALLFAESQQRATAIHGRHFYDFASGSKDDQLDPDTLERVNIRLNAMLHLFADASASHRTEILLMYRAIMLLANEGYTFTSPTRGALTYWFGEVIHGARTQGEHGFNYPIARMFEVNHLQQEFWDTHLPRIIAEYKLQHRNIA